MMKILEINAVNVGSTGKIMLMIAEEARKRGHRVITAVAKSRTNGKIVDEEQILIGDRITRNIGAQLAYYTGYTGCFSYIATRLFIKKIKKIQPDIIHIHNLHSEYINIPLLFNYIKKYNIPTIWTIHDCWPFTGCCAHFVYSNCEKWKKHCNNCPEFRSYPRSCWDNSSKMFDLKKKWYGDIKSLTLVVPSQWLADSVKKSFLGNYPIEVIYNGVDTNIYKYVNQDVRNKYGVGQDKVVLLGVAGSWSEKKGLKDYYKLIELLPEKFVIVLVGLKIKENSSNTSRLIYVENVSDAL